MIVRRFAEALRKLDQVLNITPDDLDTLVEKAAIAQAEGRGLTGRGLTEKLCVPTAKFRGISMKPIGRKIVRSPELPKFDTSISIRVCCAGIWIAHSMCRV